MPALESQPSTPVNATATDTLAPAQVTGLSATIAQGQVNLSWSAVTTNSDTTPIADLGGYRIYRKDDAAATFALVSSVAANITTYTDTSMLDGSSYIYAVSAIDNEVTPNEGAKSADLAVKTIPSVPTGLAATSGDSIVRLTWNAVTDGAQPKKNENFVGYKLYRKLTADASYAFLAQVAANVALYEDTTVVNNTEYMYEITAIDNTP